MIRKAVQADIRRIVQIYDAVLREEESGRAQTGWARGVYPTEATAAEALARQTLFVCEEEGKIVAAAKIDQTQVPAYAGCGWAYQAPEEQVMVLHTLAVHPSCSRRGYGEQFVGFYEQYALERGCRYLRMDTNEINTAARALYQKLGYREAGIVPCVFNGIPDVHLVCLEKRLKDPENGM